MYTFSARKLEKTFCGFSRLSAAAVSLFLLIEVSCDGFFFPCIFVSSLFSSVSLSKSNTSFRFEGFTSPSSLSRLRENVFPPKQPLLPFKMNVLTRFLRPSSLSCPSSPPPEFHTSLDSFLFLPLLQPPVSFSSCLQGLYVNLAFAWQVLCVYCVGTKLDEQHKYQPEYEKRGEEGTGNNPLVFMQFTYIFFDRLPPLFPWDFLIPVDETLTLS